MNSFYNDWYNRRKYWFCLNNENDEYLSSTYGYLIDEYEYTPKTFMMGILIYDQLTRHFYRNQNANHIITYFNQKALKIALEFKKEEIENLSFDDWCFYMLVYRHTNEPKHLFYVMKEAWEKLPLSKSFIKATYNRANFEENLTLISNENKNENFDIKILDVNSTTNVNANVNANINFNIKTIGDYSGLELEENKTKPIIVSLSGGVDSICCLYMIRNLFKETRKIVAVHINYNNREETEEEVKFLSIICKNLEVELYVRKIEEIKRLPCIQNDLRDIYESYTKKVRYNSYRKIDKNPLVILGHNKDDCLENILTNVAYNNKYDNLTGIELKTKIDDITFYRPLINISKDEIYKYANTYELPFLKNSTPNWSQRGKIRTNVVPVLEKWDKRLIPGLFNASKVLSDLHLNLKMNVKREFKMNMKMKIEELNLSFLYWKYGIFELFKYYPSNKSLTSLIERLETWKNKSNKIDINKKQKIIINKKLELLIWKNKELEVELMLIYISIKQS